MIFRKVENKLYDHMGIAIRPIEVVSLFLILKIEFTRRCMERCVVPRFPCVIRCAPTASTHCMPD